MADLIAVPANLLPHRTPTQLLTLARAGLAEAAQTRSDGLRYAGAHLAALRAAAAILAARATPARRRSLAVPSVWAMLPEVAPEFTEWAVYFADGASKRAAVEAGIPRVVTAAEADGMVRSAETFVDAVGWTVDRG